MSLGMRYVPPCDLTNRKTEKETENPKTQADQEPDDKISWRIVKNPFHLGSKATPKSTSPMEPANGTIVPEQPLRNANLTDATPEVNPWLATAYKKPKQTSGNRIEKRQAKRNASPPPPTLPKSMSTSPPSTRNLPAFRTILTRKTGRGCSTAAEN